MTLRPFKWTADENTTEELKNVMGLRDQNKSSIPSEKPKCTAYTRNDCKIFKSMAFPFREIKNVIFDKREK